MDWIINLFICKYIMKYQIDIERPDIKFGDLILFMHW
jgi:hypothetical protein